jgi:hypothetical protein
MKYLIHILVISATLGFCRNTNRTTSVEGLTVDARIIGRTSACDTTDRLIVQINVSNKSTDTSSFWIYKCSWENSFTIDRTDLHLYGRECVSNYPIRIDLAPKDIITFYSTVKLLSESLYHRPTTFKIGLIMLDEDKLGALIFTGIPSDSKIYWSNPIEVDFLNGYTKNP